MNNNETFNIITAGYGGQGVLTLAKILARSGAAVGYQVKQAELHGLAQRGGSLITHIRFGSEIYSPLISKGGADLIISLELGEAVRAVFEYAGENTFLLTNKKLFSPAQGRNADLDIAQVKKEVLPLLKDFKFVNADKEVRALTGDIFAVNIFMLGRVLGLGVLPLEKETVWQVVEDSLGGKYLEQNRKVFDAALVL